MKNAGPGLAWLLATGGAALVCIVCLSVETVRNRDEWREWEREMEKVRLWEMFLFRQVPFLRPDEESR